MGEKSSEFLMYQTEDGSTKIDVSIDGDTVWLTQAQMCELFQKVKSTISEHITNIFQEGELNKKLVVRKFRTTGADGKEYNTNHYNLDVIISVGYRVKSHRGTQFRIWATERLREYIIKGFTMNDELLKKAGGGNYFDELLERIRDIRSSEKVFWRKVLDIYATSIDYNPKTESSILFFKTVQNKMHWAAHGQTAAEVIFNRVNATLPNLGMTNFNGITPKKSEVIVAKNYLKSEELDILNRIVSGFLDLAELQALDQNPMYMNDWMESLEGFLKLSRKEVLTNAGKISHQDAKAKAEIEYNKYRAIVNDGISKVEMDFIASIEKVEKKINNLDK